MSFYTTCIRHTLALVAFCALLVAAVAFGFPVLKEYLKPDETIVQDRDSKLFELTGEESIKVSSDAVAAIGLETVEVELASVADPLRLPGYLLVDPNGLVPVHPRFAGEVVQIGQTELIDTNGQTYKRSVRYGDTVKEGQLLAVVWSTDIGQKKSELVDALSRLDLDQQVYEQLKSAGREVVPQRQIVGARRAVDADQIAINSARRTLISWKITREEIAQVEREAEQIRRKELQTEAAKTWSELEIRAPMDGVILEKNVNVGEIVDTNDNLFKVADLDLIQVLVYLFEEDLPLIERLTPAQRLWQIDLKSDPIDTPRQGKFEIIGSVIHQMQRTAPIIGWLDNRDRKFRVNQFVTATIALPPDPGLVSLPTSALIEEGSTAAVFVETNPTLHEVTRRVVAVTRRGEESVFIRSEPSADERREGASPLHAGERVVILGGLELDLELTNLKSADLNERGGE